VYIMYSVSQTKHKTLGRAPVRGALRSHRNPDLMWCCVRQQMFYCCAVAILKWTRYPARTETVCMYTYNVYCIHVYVKSVFGQSFNLTSSPPWPLSRPQSVNSTDRPAFPWLINRPRDVHSTCLYIPTYKLGIYTCNFPFV